MLDAYAASPLALSHDGYAASGGTPTGDYRPSLRSPWPAAGEFAAIEAIKCVSPIAWQHINFYGHYHFEADFSPIDLAAIRQYLSSVEALRFYAALRLLQIIGRLGQNPQVASSKCHHLMELSVPIRDGD